MSLQSTCERHARLSLALVVEILNSGERMTSTKIRGDFKEVEGHVSRLLAIGEEFRSKDRDWSHMKNREDWGRNRSVRKRGSSAESVGNLGCR